ncbi:MAG: DUF1893 domain-containing protein [Kiritimatiellae bacterium]|nr:DUF1893 domain-containing protein [Kiritimatiellia bacterium]
MVLKRQTVAAIAKRSAAAVFLVLCIWAFFGGHRLAQTAVRLQLVPALLRNPLVAAPVFIVATALFGRFFCEMMCPLGILQSLANWMSRPRGQVRRVCTRLPQTKVQMAVRWSVFAVFAALLGLGFGALAWSLEPYTIFARAMTLSGVFSFVLAAIVLLAAFGKGRIWCNWICPAGSVLNLLSRFAPFGNRVEKRCANCRRCFVSKNTAVSADNSDAPSSKDAEKGSEAAGVTRREALKGVAVLAVADKLVDGGLAEIVLPGNAVRERTVLPPGALSRNRFRRVCLGCGLCIKSCPTGVLSPSVSLRTFNQPEIDFSRGVCSPYCDGQCSKACPAGALKIPRGVPRSDVHIGVAVWHAERCLRTAEGVQCSLCERKCPAGAIHIEGGVPVVDELACIGCGICERQCAARPEPALVVEGLDIQRVVVPMGEEDLVAEMKRLLDEGASVVVAKDGVISGRESGSGISPLLKLHDSGDLRGAIVVDKVIGRAAAAICLSGGAASVHAKVMAAGARDMLLATGVKCDADTMAATIVNRQGTDSCPMEKAVEGLDDPASMVEAIRRRIAEIQVK